jgi:hypothetical protein
MGMCAEIVAWGPFSSDIAKYLDYPPDFYSSTAPGVMVLTTLFGIVEGSTASREFASCLGISDPWDFSQHKFDADRIDVVALAYLFQTLSEGDAYLKELDRLLALRANGFQFMFRPNG